VRLGDGESQFGFIIIKAEYFDIWLGDCELQCGLKNMNADE
jgi:hypothetical protein